MSAGRLGRLPGPRAPGAAGRLPARRPRLGGLRPRSWCWRRRGGRCESRSTRCSARCPARHTGTGAGVAEVAMVVFSLTAVVALVTGNLEGPLATLAPTLLAVAVGLLLGRALGPATRLASTPAAAQRPGGGRGRHRQRRTPALGAPDPGDGRGGQRAVRLLRRRARHRPAQPRRTPPSRQNGAPYVARDPGRDACIDVVAAVAEADPDRRAPHPRGDDTTGTSRSGGGATVAVDPTAFPRVAYFPLSRPSRDDWAAIGAPQVDPVRLTGATLAGTVDAAEIRFSPGRPRPGRRRSRIGSPAAGRRRPHPPRADLAVIPPARPRRSRSRCRSRAPRVHRHRADRCRRRPVVELAGHRGPARPHVDGAPYSASARPRDWRRISGRRRLARPGRGRRGQPRGHHDDRRRRDRRSCTQHVGARAGAGPGHHGGGRDVHRAGPRGPGQHDGRGHPARVPGSPPGSRRRRRDGLLRGARTQASPATS